jgi:hypothetical protein
MPLAGVHDVIDLIFAGRATKRGCCENAWSPDPSPGEPFLDSARRSSPASEEGSVGLHQLDDIP